MSQINYSRYKYTPDEMDENDFLSRFVVRNEIFENIFDEIKNANYDITNQHYIIVGQRGQGKTTLLRKLQLEVQKDEQLSKFLLPVKFAEEQYQIRSLCRLWEEVADYLQTIYEDEFKTILDDMEKHFEDDDYELRCFSYFEKLLKSKKKKLLLLIDNIDELLGKLKEKEQKQLREILLTSSSFIIVGGSTKMFDQQYEYGKPFYEFFKIVKLQGLNRQESIELLKVIGKDKQKKKIEKVIKETPERIETLRQLTGGVPRTIIMLFDIFTDEDGNAFEDLLKVLDEVTPLYKHRMDDLPPPLQDIVHTIALNWDGMFTKDIAKKTRLQSKEVSAQLKQLEKYQLIEAESTGKNKIYKIQERFFNIWYLMRFGRKKDRHKVEWLVKFLLSWFSRSELESRANKFIGSLKNGKVKESYAYHMCEALSYAGLEMETEYAMKKNVKKYLSEINSKLVNELSKSDIEIFEEVETLRENNKNDDAIKLILSSKKSSKEILVLLAFLYSEQKEYPKAEKYYLKAIENGDMDALFFLANLYKEQKEYVKAEEYYLKAIEAGNNDALFNLGNLYSEQKEYKKAEEYYLKVIEDEEDDADALNNLGNLYGQQKDYLKAEACYLKSLENKNDNNVLFNLGILYKEQKEYEKAEEYYLKAIESGDNDALRNLGLLYKEQKEYAKAEEYYLKAIESGDNDALFNLGVLYKEQKEYAKAEEYYLKAIESGDNDALNSLSWFYFEQGMKSDEALSLIERSYKIEQRFYNIHTLATILLWKEEFSKSYEKFLEWLEYNNALESEEDVILYLNLLLSKGQYYKAKEFFEIEKYQLKDRYKPIWYALMKLLEKEFPDEIKKMGSELQESVDEVLVEIERLKVKYA